VTETIEFSGLEDYTKYTVTYRKNTAESGDPDYVYAKLYVTTEREKACCSYYKTVDPGTGVLKLYLGKTDCGSFEFEQTDDGWTIQSTETGKYLAFNPENNSYTESDEPFSWKYDGSFYTTEETVVTTRCLFWKRTKVVTVKYHLTANKDGFAVCTVRTPATVKELVTNTEHTFAYKNCGDTHLGTCICCGAQEEQTKHCYDKDGRCVCGKVNPEICYVTGVKVIEKKTVSNVRFLFWTRTTTKYQYIICTEASNVGVKKVQYSGDGDKWNTGTVVTSDVKLNTFYIRVTDTEDKVTNWVYRDGNVTIIR